MGKLSREKLTTDVVFPLKGLDLTPYLSGSTPINSSNPRPLYDLTGIAHHSGTMHGGHYVATCGVGQEGALKWVNFNDSKTTSVSVNNLSGPSAYVLFYKLQYDTK
jgi:ubiquitin C-terminal hydrolase